jgi:DNA topoisomerase-3
MENPSKFLIDKSLKDNLSGKLKIGTEATRATEIKDICGKTGYAEKKKGKGKNELIYALPKSMNLISQIKQFEVTSVDMTAKLEYKLDLIKTGELRAEDYYKEMKENVREQVKAIKNENISVVATNSKKVIAKCSCGGDIVVGEKSVFCSNWKEKGCKHGFPKVVLGAKITDNDVEKLFAGKTITKTLKKDDKSWKQQLKLSANHTLEFVKDENIDEDMLCPECGSPIKITDKCYSCSDRECNFVIWNTVCNAKISKSDAKKLVEGKRIKKTMVSKAGKEFEGYLVLKDGKVSIEFE